MEEPRVKLQMAEHGETGYRPGMQQSDRMRKRSKAGRNLSNAVTSRIKRHWV